jgi:Domain of unknown function (DUF6456)
MLSPLLVDRNVPSDGVNASVRKVRSVTVNLAESPLGWLRARGMLSERQFVAGEALRHDYERAGLTQRTTMAWDAAPTSKVARGGRSHGASTIAQIDAKRQFGAAIAAAGRGLSDILWRVVCAGESVPVAEKSLGWPARGGRLVLTLALDRIADYYRVP